ncbi:MAG: hypothetical protein R3Y63_11385 [Eubacteriales bacterium]
MSKTLKKTLAKITGISMAVLALGGLALVSANESQKNAPVVYTETLGDEETEEETVTPDPDLGYVTETITFDLTQGSYDFEVNVYTDMSVLGSVMEYPEDNDHLIRFLGVQKVEASGDDDGFDALRALLATYGTAEEIELFVDSFEEESGDVETDSNKKTLIFVISETEYSFEIEVPEDKTVIQTLQGLAMEEEEIILFLMSKKSNATETTDGYEVIRGLLRSYVEKDGELEEFIELLKLRVIGNITGEQSESEAEEILDVLTSANLLIPQG